MHRKVNMNKEEIAEILVEHKKWLGNTNEGKRADFRGMDLFGACFRKSDLNEVIFDGADLRLTDFYGASLAGAYFCGVNLYRSNFVKSNLCRAYFRGAYLEGANFEGVDLEGVYFQDANMVGAEFSGIKNYEDIHGIGFEIIRRQGVDFLTLIEKEVAFDVLLYKKCWDEIIHRDIILCRNIFKKLADLGFSEYLQKFEHEVAK